MKQLFLTGLIAFLFSATIVASEARWVHQEKTYITSDNLILHGWVGIPTAKKSNDLILLLPMMGQTHDSFEPFLKALSSYIDETANLDAYPHILSFDLRGHGKSTHIDSTQISFSDMTAEDFARIPIDIAAMTESILGDSTLGLTIDSLVIIGASIGANTAALLTRSLDNVKSIVLLSPGENYRSLRPAEAIRQYDRRLLLFAGRDDNYSAVSTKELGKLNKKSKVMIFDTKDHGTRMINNDSVAMKRMVEWIMADTSN